MPDDDPGELGEAVARLHRTVRRAVLRGGGHPPLPDAQVELLRLVERTPGVGVGAAAEVLRMAPNTVSTLVRDLVGAGLLTRAADPADRRCVRLSLTEAARRRLAEFRAHRARVLTAALARLDPRDRAALGAVAPLLGRLADLVDAGPAVDAAGGAPAGGGPAAAEERRARGSAAAEERRARGPAAAGPPAAP
ncbi:MAG TPA: MarR family transcriptional regulator [Pilimelia sp.]|nr:MarR family transcriptional regulator [Pilimelia sp.]